MGDGVKSVLFQLEVQLLGDGGQLAYLSVHPGGMR